MKTRSQLLRAAFVGVVVLGSSLIGTAFSSPANADSDAVMCLVSRGMAAKYPKLAALPQDENARAAALNTAVIRLRQQGMSDAKVDATLDAEYGMTVVGTEPATKGKGGGFSARIAAPGNLTVRTTIYRETCGAVRYTVFGYWDWDSIPRLKQDAPRGCNKCAVGPFDVMGIALSRDIDDPGGYSAQSWGATRVFPVAERNIGDTNNHGFSMEDQDRFCTSAHCSADDYNMYHGQLVMGIDDPGCGKLTAHAKYGHSRNGVVLNGVSIGIDSVGISWSNNTYAFNKAAAASNTVKPC